MRENAVIGQLSVHSNKSTVCSWVPRRKKETCGGWWRSRRGARRSSTALSKACPHSSHPQEPNVETDLVYNVWVECAILPSTELYRSAQPTPKIAKKWLTLKNRMCGGCSKSRRERERSFISLACVCERERDLFCACDVPQLLFPRHAPAL